MLAGCANVVDKFHGMHTSFASEAIGPQVRLRNSSISMRRFRPVPIPLFEKLSEKFVPGRYRTGSRIRFGSNRFFRTPDDLELHIFDNSSQSHRLPSVLILRIHQPSSEGHPPTALCMICRCSLRGVKRLPKTIILLSSPAITLDRCCSIESIPMRATGAGSIISIRIIGVFC